MADDREDPGDHDWAFIRYGAFHIPIPSWATPVPNPRYHPMIKYTMEILKREVGTFGEKGWCVLFAEGTQDQRLWTAMTIAHREMYYAGIRGASTEYVNYHICLRLWIQRDIICYSFGIPRHYKWFPYVVPPVSGFDVEGEYARACMRFNVPFPREQQLGQFCTLYPEVASTERLEAMGVELLASQRATRAVQAQLDASQREVQTLQGRLDNSQRVRVQRRNFRRNVRVRNFRQRGRRPSGGVNASNNEVNAANNEVNAANSEANAPDDEVEGPEDQGQHSEV